jgi:hypothetical protein
VNGLGQLRALKKLVVRVPVGSGHSTRTSPACITEKSTDAERGGQNEEDEETAAEVLATFCSTLRTVLSWCVDITVERTEKRSHMTPTQRMEQVFVW